MSVTFSCPGSGYKTVPCSYCAAARDAGYIKADENCTPGCDGTERVYDAPECNFANGNAYVVLGALGLANEELYGHVENKDLPALRKKIIRAMNSSRTVSGMVRPSEEFTGAKGCKVIQCGTPEESVLYRFNALLTLAAYAQEHGYDITWG